MGRRRKAWLWGGTGKWVNKGRRLPGYCAPFHECRADGTRRNRSIRFLKLADARRWVERWNVRADQRRLGDLGEVAPIPLPEAVAEFMAG